jgi:hypothetical protein
MKLSTYLTIVAVVAFLFGIALVLPTEQFLALYNVRMTPAGFYAARLFGAALIGFGLLNWFSRSATDSEARRAIIIANLGGSVLGLVVALIGQVQGVVNSLGWSTVVIFLLLALGFAYFQFVKKS